jgi:Asparaginase, N-terminal
VNRRWVVLLVLLTAVLRAQAPLPRVVVLATGGTIASRFDPAIGALAPAATGADLVRAVPGLDKIARVDVEQIANIGSYDMTPDIWRHLSRRTNELLATNDVAGVVVTHGTDTLEETAYFLDLTVTSPKPVIVVGAQRASSYFDTDGPRNLLNAVRVAVSPEAVGKGALVVMNGQINAAREVTKTSTIEVETFKTLEFGALGVVLPCATAPANDSVHRGAAARTRGNRESIRGGRWTRDLAAPSTGRCGRARHRRLRPRPRDGRHARCDQAGACARDTRGAQHARLHRPSCSTLRSRRRNTAARLHPRRQSEPAQSQDPAHAGVGQNDQHRRASEILRPVAGEGW